MDRADLTEERVETGVRVHEVFFVLLVSDMSRSVQFYEQVLGAKTSYASPAWTSVRIGGVRLGLSLVPSHAPCETQLHFAVEDLDVACDRVLEAGGQVDQRPLDLVPGVRLARARDPEGNAFSFTLAG